MRGFYVSSQFSRCRGHVRKLLGGLTCRLWVRMLEFLVVTDLTWHVDALQAAPRRDEGAQMHLSRPYPTPPELGDLGPHQRL
jgi:hypothetical protein